MNRPGFCEECGAPLPVKEDHSGPCLMPASDPTYGACVQCQRHQKLMVLLSDVRTLLDDIKQKVSWGINR